MNHASPRLPLHLLLVLVLAFVPHQLLGQAAHQTPEGTALRPRVLDNLDLNLSSTTTAVTGVIFDRVGPVDRIVVTDHFNGVSLFNGNESNVRGHAVFFDGVPSPGTLVPIPANLPHGEGALERLAIAVFGDAPRGADMGSAYVCSRGLTSWPCCRLQEAGCNGAGGSPEHTKQTCRASDWEGVWDTSWNQMTLTAGTDGVLSGTYNTQRHQISGRPSNSNSCVFEGRWRHANSSRSGRVRFEMVAPGRFEGGYVSGDAEVTTSNWRGTRRSDPPSRVTCGPSDWAGTWDTSWNQMNLTVRPDGTLAGTYNTQRHRISGRPSNTNPCVFVGRWQHANSSRSGRVRFEMIAPGRFQGAFSQGEAEPQGTAWKGTKR